MLLTRPTRILCALGACTLFGALLAAGSSSAPKEDAQVSLPEGSVARAWAGVGPQTAALELQGVLFSAHPWLSEAQTSPASSWRGWGALVRSEASNEESDAASRAALALFAGKQGRWQDAWAHLERLGGFPEWSAAVMPTLLPGAPLDSPAGVGGLPGALPDGVLLTPAIPPSDRELRSGQVPTSTASVSGLRVGEATVDFRITIDGSGIQVDLLHTGGGPAKVKVLLPEPEGLEIRVEYIDWMRQDEMRLPLELELLPGEEEHNLFGRFRPRRVPLPASPRKQLPRALEHGGLWFEWGGADGPLAKELESAAEVMAATLEVRGGLVRPADPPPGEPWSATLMHVPSEPADARRFLARIASRLEAWVLRGPGAK